MKRARVMFVVESGADVRLIEGLADCFELTVLARKIRGGVEISQRPAGEARIEIGPASRARFAREVFRVLRRAGARLDAVIVQGYGAAALAANVAGRLEKLPVYMLVCSPVEKYYLCRRAGAEASKPFRRGELLALSVLARVNARAGQHYIVLGEHLREVVREHGARLPVSIIPVYGVDTEIFSPTVETNGAVRERLGLPASGRVIFFSSRVAPEKDAATLLAAFRMLLEEGHDLWLLHRSGGHVEFKEAADKAGVAARLLASDAVHPHRELPDYYRASDLCVQASREEGLGFSVLEALACGTPVVAAHVGGLRETIIEGETGWSYAPGDAAALARAIEDALRDTEEAARRARAGREMVLARYDRRDAFAHLVELVEARLRERRNAAAVEQHGQYVTCSIESASEQETKSSR